jgi:CO/xanthine dehydrogenase FAD-binding subunit
VKKVPAKFVYTAMRNSRTDFPILTCAVSETNGTYRAAVGARPARAMVLTDETGILAEGITEERADAFAKWVAGQIPTGSNLRGSAAYRTHLAQVLTRRALQELEG